MTTGNQALSRSDHMYKYACTHGYKFGNLIRDSWLTPAFMTKPLSWTRPSKRSWKSILSPISPYLSSSQGSERAWPSVNFSLSSFCISSSLKVTPGTKCGLLSCPVVATGLRLQPWTKWKKQQVSSTTHQFMTSHRSLYLLAGDDCGWHAFNQLLLVLSSDWSTCHRRMAPTNRHAIPWQHRLWRFGSERGKWWQMFVKTPLKIWVHLASSSTTLTCQYLV